MLKTYQQVLSAHLGLQSAVLALASCRTGTALTCLVI